MQSFRRLDEFINILKKENLLVEIQNYKDLKISNISIDSQKISKNGLFVCIKGFVNDGHDYAKSAQEKGAVAVVCEKPVNLPSKITMIIVSDSRKAEAVLASHFYNTDSHNFKLIGITGTNGKTTTAYLLEKILTSLGYKCGVIGTLGYRINGKSFPLERTTPNALKLHEIFANMKDCDYVIMEVSSHSLSLDRVYSLKFDLAIFTNLTREHLDFYKDLNDYANAKFKLFSQVKNKGFAIFNIDDFYGKKFYNLFKGNKFSISFKNGDITIQENSVKETGSLFELKLADISTKFQTKLIGHFNIYNLTFAIASVTKLTQVHITELDSVVKSINSPAGRMQRVEVEGKNIFVDYAHTPDALNNVLSALDDIKKGRIITVFGTGGNRDKSKRPKMYEIATLYSDTVIVTTDNPRNENPVDILEDIFSEGFKEKTLVYLDRRTAIYVAIHLARKNDIVLIAGKGHEKYQEIMGQKYHFDDVEEIYNYKNFKQKGNLYIPLSLYWLYKVLNKKIHNNFKDKIFYNIFTDSRHLSDDSIFFAFKGDKFDAHDFVFDILKNFKNVFCIIDKSREKSYNSSKTISVADTISTYGELAKYYKKLFSPTTIAITGSVGKTTTKEYLALIFSKVGSVHKTFGNENNQIGVPKTIFNYKNEDYMILELGTNHPGEIEYLEKIVLPDVAIITKIGFGHLEFFKSKKEVFNEKIKIFAHNPKIKLVDDDYEFFTGKDYLKVGYTKFADYQITDVKSIGGKTYFKFNKKNYSITTPYSVFVQNAAFAILTATLKGIDTEIIKESLKPKLIIENRMEIVKKSGIIFLDDSYNANPDSMKAAIDFWTDYLPEKEHIAILGDMYELGTYEISFHKEIGEKLKHLSDKKIVSVGKLSKHYGSTLHFNDVESLLNSDFLKTIKPKTVVLIKGSHGLRLDKIVRSL